MKHVFEMNFLSCISYMYIHFRAIMEDVW